MKTHQLSPELNEAISNFRNAAWRQRDLTAARAALESAITAALAQEAARANAAMKVEIQRFPGMSQILEWLADSAASADEMASVEMRQGTNERPEDIAFWQNEGRMARAAFRVIAQRHPEAAPKDLATGMPD